MNHNDTHNIAFFHILLYTRLYEEKNMEESKKGNRNHHSIYIRGSLYMVTSVFVFS